MTRTEAENQLLKCYAESDTEGKRFIWLYVRIVQAMHTAPEDQRAQAAAIQDEMQAQIKAGTLPPDMVEPYLHDMCRALDLDPEQAAAIPAIPA